MPPVPRHNIAHPRQKTEDPLSLIDRLIYVAAVAEPLANLPQVFTIYSLRNASGVSITSWILYMVFAAIWLWYGIHTKQRPMIIAAMLFLATDLAVVMGALMFGGTVWPKQ
jgi:uncharacterized protein with PQ loop repeat